MAKYNVQHPETGKWAMFSSVSDMFITDWMDKDAYEEWRKEHLYGGSDYYDPVEKCNIAEYHACVIDYVASGNGLTCFEIEEIARQRGKWIDG